MNPSPQSDLLRSAAYIDSAHPSIIEYAGALTKNAGNDRERAIVLAQAVRDKIRYDVYVDYDDPATFRASGVLAAGRGFCVGKAALLAACCRAAGVPARVGYADVRNHMTSPRLQSLIGTDVFAWHSYTDILIDGTWVKATPAFDRELCARAGIPPLEFDGRTDSLLQESDPDGRRRMEYLRLRGTYADVPFETIIADFHALYPGLIEAGKRGGDFRGEARAPRSG